MNKLYTQRMSFVVLALLGLSAQAQNVNVGLGVSVGKGPGFAQGIAGPGYAGGFAGSGAGYAGGFAGGGFGGICGGACYMPPPCFPTGPAFYNPNFGPWNTAPVGPIGPIAQRPPMPLPPPLPPPPRVPMIPPPNLALGNIGPAANAGWGPGFGAFPGPGFVGQGNVCAVACHAGMVNTLPMGPVAGGPLLDGGGFFGGHHGYASEYSIYGSNNTIIDMRDGPNAWELTDTADIVLAAGIGMGMQATNVYPFLGYRNEITIPPYFYQTGDRDFGFVPRPHVAP